MDQNSMRHLLSDLSTTEKYNLQKKYYTDIDFRNKMDDAPDGKKFMAVMNHDGTSGAFNFTYNYLGNNASTPQTYVSSLGNTSLNYGYTSAGQLIPSSFNLYFAMQRISTSSEYNSSQFKKHGIMICDVSN
jgi:hypothetical protein